MLYRKTNNQYGLAEVYLGRGIVFLNQQNYAQAQVLIDTAERAYARNPMALITGQPANRDGEGE